MSTSTSILYTSESNPDQKATVAYTYNDDFTEVTITDYTIEGVSDAKYPKFTSEMNFQGVFVNSDGTLVSAAGFIGDTPTFSCVTGSIEGGKNQFDYYSTEGTFNGVEPCSVSIP